MTQPRTPLSSSYSMYVSANGFFDMKNGDFVSETPKRSWCLGQDSLKTVIGRNSMESTRIYGNCYLCNSELCGKVVEVGGKRYHSRCFYCCKCRKPLCAEDCRMRDVCVTFGCLMR